MAKVIGASAATVMKRANLYFFDEPSSYLDVKQRLMVAKEIRRLSKRKDVMVVEHAERFGLAQLHQLRGRIGRGGDDGQCLLIAEALTQEGKARLKVILSSTDGFKIAQRDLQIRGPGHYFGRHQHGFNELRFVDPLKQIDVLELARKEAEEVIHVDPALDNAEYRNIRQAISYRYPGYLANIEAG